MAAVTVGALPADTRPRLSHQRLGFTFPFLVWHPSALGSIVLITLPQQARLIGGDQAKGQTLGVVLLFGTLVSMFVAPLFGALRDRIVTRIGHRRPWMIVGTVMNIGGAIRPRLYPKGK